jgi:hypothetical protein
MTAEPTIAVLPAAAAGCIACPPYQDATQTVFVAILT